ncbi:unnamed protein product [Cylindrotheca closterium]|uniref:Cyclic nucleotide-binding domain-containing protein n=1 Tax=Cylindrotheca closterium TaxID=2856 RepID=A0AAD2G1L1_9STRA|nr:unnamed protein product [Cylindrotheca closterium]
MAFILLSIWVQLGSFFFLLSGLIGDLLLIRLFLYLAYVMLLTNALLGSPPWPKILSVDQIAFSEVAMDSFVWAILSLYVHGSSLVALIWDERAPKLTDDEAALWRMMYRTGGLSARLFQDVVARHLHVVEVEAGDVVDTENFFFIIYRGRIELEVLEGKKFSHSRVLTSGEMFDLKSLGLVRTESIFDNSSVRCTALCPSKLFEIRKENLVKIAQNPLSKSLFQALLINNLMYIVESYREINHTRSENDNYCSKIFDPLEEWEQPESYRSGSGKALQRPLRHIWKGVRGSFGLPWPFSRHPVGLRQTQLPPPLRRDEYQKPL